MAPSTSSGRQSNKDPLPYEQKGRMAWDPVYKAKYQDEFPSSESDNDDDDSDEEYPTGPYVSGGLQPGRRTTDDASARSGTPAIIQGNNPVAKGACRNPTSRSGFQSVPKKHSQKKRVLRSMNNFNRDNTAKAAFRKRASHTGVFKLPRNCNEIEPNRAKMYDFLEELGVRLGSFIRPPQTLLDHDLLIWGNTEQVRRTIAELRNWLSPATQAIRPKPKAKDEFADIHSVRGERYKKLQTRIKYEADVRRFQQEPVQGRVFDFSGSFLWPADEITPTDLLGANLEALDPLRIKFQCHIMFDARMSAFKILTNNEDAVKKTLVRIQGIMKEYVARINRPIVRYYIEPPNQSAFRGEIKTIPRKSILPKSGSAFVPLLTGEPLELEARGKWLRQSASLKSQSNRGIEDALRKTIPNLRFYRGQVRMRVHFGTFALTDFRWASTASSIPFEDFMGNMAMPGTKGTMIRDLEIRKDAAFVVQKIHAANKLFQPIDNYTEFLKDVSPSFSAYFECCEPGKEPVKLEVEMLSDATDPTVYVKSYSVWSRLGRQDNSSPLSIFMTRLDGGPSWQLQALTENIVDSSRTTPKMRSFAESVKLKKAYDAKVELTGEKVFEWDKAPGSMLVRAFEQKTSLKFRLIRNMEYMVELSRYDTYEYPTMNGPPGYNHTRMPQTQGPPLKENRPTSSQLVEPRLQEHHLLKTNWGATLWNADWDSELMANTNLGIGEAAKWDPRLTTFFPNRSGALTAEGVISEGVSEFLEIVSDVNNFLNDIKQTRPHLRA